MKNHIKIIKYICFSTLFFVCLPELSLSKGPDISFEGTWKTNYGELIMKLEDNKLNGRYIYLKSDKKAVTGKIEGTVSKNGMEANGEWDEGQTGTFKFILSMDGKKINGKFWYRNNVFGGQWNGVRSNTNTVKIPHDALWI